MSIPVPDFREFAYSLSLVKTMSSKKHKKRKLRTMLPLGNSEDKPNSKDVLGP